MSKHPDSSWEKVAKQYDRSVSQKGHYYHRNVILPQVLRLLELSKDSSILDLGCGQGVLSRVIPSYVPYLGIDASESLVKTGRSRSDSQSLRKFVVRDLSLPVNEQPPIEKNKFSHAAAILSLQNMEQPVNAIRYTASQLKDVGGIFVAVLNHPCFRIPRSSSWGTDPHQHNIYRRIDRYMTPATIPVVMNPGNSDNPKTTFSFHLSLSSWVKAFTESGFLISSLEEWTSDKISTGSKAKVENRARQEFPLFLAIKAYKLPVKK